MPIPRAGSPGRSERPTTWSGGALEAGPSGSLRFRRRCICLSVRRTTAPRRMAAAWLVSACIQVALPGLYWQHYYLLPIAGVAIVVAVCWTDALRSIAHGPLKVPICRRKRLRNSIAVLSVLLLSLAVGATVFLQVRDYLLVAPEELTIRYKGGRQWVVLRQMGRELARRSHHLAQSSPVCLGLAKPVAVLRKARQPDPPLLRRQPAARPGRPQSPLDPAAHRRDHRALRRARPS